MTSPSLREEKEFIADQRKRRVQLNVTRPREIQKTSQREPLENLSSHSEKGRGFDGNLPEERELTGARLLVSTPGGERRAY